MFERLGALALFILVDWSVDQLVYLFIVLAWPVDHSVPFFVFLARAIDYSVWRAGFCICHDLFLSSALAARQETDWATQLTLTSS